MPSKRAIDYIIPFFILFFPTSFFGYQFVVRILPSLVTEELMQQISGNAESMGSLAAAYYLGYSLSHIPMAMLIEKIQPRFAIAGGAFACAALLLLFHSTTNFYVALFTRMAIGVVSSLGFVGVSKVALMWFSQKNYGLVFGIAFTTALFGAVFAGNPLANLLDAYGLAHMVNMIAIAGCVVGLGALIFVRPPRDGEGDSSNAKNSVSTKDIWKLLLSVEIMLMGFVTLSMVGLYDGFVDLWGVPYMVVNYGLSKNEAAGAIAFVFFGLMCGNSLLAALGKLIGDAAAVVVSGVLTTAIFCGIVLWSGEYNWYVFIPSFFVLGVLASYQVLVLSMCANVVSSRMATVAVSFMNCVNMIGGVFFHWSIGFILQYLWNGTYDNGNMVYSPESFKIALLVIPLGNILGAIVVVIVNKMIARNATFHE